MRSFISMVYPMQSKRIRSVSAGISFAAAKTARGSPYGLSLIHICVENIITFDAHDPRVQNAIPLKGFETVQPIYQFIKYLLKNEKELEIDSDHMMVISPDEGGMAVSYTHLDVYKRQNL